MSISYRDQIPSSWDVIKTNLITFFKIFKESEKNLRVTNHCSQTVNVIKIHTASSAPGYGTQPLHWHQMQKKTLKVKQVPQKGL